MHKCNFTDRIEIQRGLLTRIVTAHWKEKSLDVYKRDETGREQSRNLYLCMMWGYGVAFPGEKIYSRFNDIQSLDPWSKTTISVNSPLGCGIPSFRSLGLVTEKYPDFRYVIQKCKLNSDEIIRVLPIWKSHPEVELILQAGYKRIAFSKKFYTLSTMAKKKVITFLRANAEKHENYGISDVLSMIRFGIKETDVTEYKNFMSHNGERFSYQEYLYLKEKKYQEIRIYADYKRMLKQTTHSIRDDYWHYPKSIIRAHNKVMHEIERANLMKKAEELKKRNEEYILAVKKHLKKRLITRSGISVYIPDSVEDIQLQSKALKQCLITSDYIGRVIQKKCVLLFVREKDRPIATAELRPDGTIGQFYGNELNHNDCLPPKCAKNAVNKWIDKYSRRIVA